MANIRRIAREKLREVLADGTDGFNAKLAAVAATYGVTAFTIDFAPPSRNFAISFLADDRDIDVSTLIEFPAMVLYASTAINENIVRGQKFSGQVLVHLAAYLRYRALTDAVAGGNTISESAATQDTEGIVDAVVDAVIEAITSQSSKFSSSNMTRGGYRVDPDPVSIYGDGYGQRVAFTFDFTVHA